MTKSLEQVSRCEILGNEEAVNIFLALRQGKHGQVVNVTFTPLVQRDDGMFVARRDPASLNNSRVPPFSCDLWQFYYASRARRQEIATRLKGIGVDGEEKFSALHHDMEELIRNAQEAGWLTFGHTLPPVILLPEYYGAAQNGIKEIEVKDGKQVFVHLQDLLDFSVVRINVCEMTELGWKRAMTWGGKFPSLGAPIKEWESRRSLIENVLRGYADTERFVDAIMAAADKFVG